MNGAWSDAWTYALREVGGDPHIAAHSEQSAWGSGAPQTHPTRLACLGSSLGQQGPPANPLEQEKVVHVAVLIDEQARRVPATKRHRDAILQKGSNLKNAIFVQIAGLLLACRNARGLLAMPG